jgi:hypothetical protein
MKSPRLKIGDPVRPIPEWAAHPDLVPRGRITRIADFGKGGAIVVDSRPTIAYCAEAFELDPEPDPT